MPELKINMQQNGTTASTKYYIDQYYEKETRGSTVRQCNYIYGDNGIVALYVKNGSLDSMYYVHTDHLGSYDVITNAGKQVVQRAHFDPWGNVKRYNNWLLTDTGSVALTPTYTSLAFTVVPRGFTGHEHYAKFRIINMNGRLYDPVIGRFFSPDSYVQAPGFTQSFNRYSYCLNNPLSYTDPSGEKWWQWLLGDVLSGGVLSSTTITTGLSTYATIFPFTNQGYELQKYLSPIAIKPDFGFGSEQNSLGVDVSIGMLKTLTGIPAYRFHAGISYDFSDYGNYSSWETRIGGEWQILPYISYSGTKFSSGEFSQTLNKITVGGPFTNASYENDYMFDLGEYLPLIPNADGGDRWRTAVVGMNFGPLSINLNMFTGNPDSYGTNHDRQDHVAMIDGHLTYTGGTANKYRAGVLSIGIGSLRVGRNSEQIRKVFQNQLAHDFLTHGEAKWFEVLDILPIWYWYLGSGNGNTLW